MSAPHDSFSHSVPTGGQFRAYGDSYWRTIVTAPPESTLDEVWAYCQTVAPCPNRCQERRQFDGSCGFPFGLSSFAGLFKKGEAWEYTIIHPYCD